MRARDLVLRCYAEKADGLWQAICLDFNLAAQGDSLDEARAKLEAQIAEYVLDAVVGEDREYANQLLKRSAPLKYWAKYAWATCCKRFNSLPRFYAFHETLPLVPQP